MRLKNVSLLPLLVVALTHQAVADPLLTSWVTSFSGQYARIYETDADRLSGSTRTTWPSSTYSSQVSVGQSSPTYVGPHEISYSATKVYVKTTGLAIRTMGPWYLNTGRTTIFQNQPKNQSMIYSIPRTPSITGTHTSTGGGPIGLFVDGVAMFDGRDAFSVSQYISSTSVNEGQPGLGIWNRDAYINESTTFDPANAHQPGNGQYHYHINPIALRYLLNDNILFDGTTKYYSENLSGTSLQHSPILGWAADGLPIYGPYGYSIATSATSGVRRMVSGFVRRDGQNGTTNLSSTGRTTLPAWAKRAQNRATLTSSQYGPNVTTTYPLGRYLEDNDYLGDLGKTQGVDFDLNEYNCRYCVTPEYPSGTYAYFMAITGSGSPAFPYIIGRQFYGVSQGGTVTSITESVTTSFKGGPSLTEAMSTPTVNSNTASVTLTWSSLEGGTYKMETSSTLTSWSPSTIPAASGTSTSYTDSGATNLNTRKFYRITRTGLATYDSSGF